MNLPVAEQIKLLFSTPCILYFRHEGHPDKPHNFVVLNAKPFDDPFLIMVEATSKVQKMRDRIRMGYTDGVSVVIIAPNKYKHFVLETAFDCNKVIKYEWEAVFKMVESGHIQRREIEPELLRKITMSVQVSRKADKKYLRYVTR